jgi:S1-C subfamily serine protease
MAIALETAVTRIRKADGAIVGAGFLVTGQLVLTCAHVVAQALGVSETTSECPAGEVKLDFPLLPPSPLLSAEVVFWLPVQAAPASVTGQGEDIAVLQLRSPPATARPVRLVKGKDLWGHPFRAFGFPASQDYGVWTTGELRAPQAAGWVQMDGVNGTAFRVEPGFSGGPVLDDELDGVVGMVVAAVRGPERVAFCIPTQTLIGARPELDRHAIPVCPYRACSPFASKTRSFSAAARP